jgi:hypothetical protein
VRRSGATNLGDKRQRRVRLHDRYLDSLTKFLKHDYWERLWIVQEIILGRHLYIKHGSWEIPVDLLVEFRYLLRDVDFEGVCLPDHIDWIVENTGRSDAGTAKSNFRSSKISFTELVDTFCSPKCEKSTRQSVWPARLGRTCDAVQHQLP